MEQALRKMTMDDAERISSPAIRKLVAESIFQTRAASSGENLRVVYDYDKFTHTKTSCQCLCLIGGMG